jgi:Protein of unknown function (DUF1153)
VGPRAYSAAAIASIRRAYRKSERDPLIGNLSEDEFAKPRKRLVVLVEEESKQISGQATAVGVGTGSSNPNVWRSGSLRAKEICPDPRHRDLVKLLAGRGIPQEHIRQLIRNPQTGRGRCPWCGLCLRAAATDWPSSDWVTVCAAQLAPCGRNHRCRQALSSDLAAERDFARSAAKLPSALRCEAITIEEACRRYGLSEEKFLSWQRVRSPWRSGAARHSPSGLP